MSKSDQFSFTYDFTIANPVQLDEPQQHVVSFYTASHTLHPPFSAKTVHCPNHLFVEHQYPVSVPVYDSTDTLHFDWFARMESATSPIGVDVLVASGSIPFQQLMNGVSTPIPLYDLQNTQQAFLFIQSQTDKLLLASQFDPHVLTQQQKEKQSKCQQMINATQDFYIKLSKWYPAPVDSYFAYVQTPSGRYPLTAFVYSSRLIQYSPNDAYTLFNHLLDVAAFTCGFEATFKCWKRLNVQQRGNWIGEMFTSFTRCLIYRPDTVRTGGGGIRVSEQWSRLFTFPDPARAAYDCEDGAASILELIHVFKNAWFMQHPLLHAVQDYLRMYYTSCLVIGSIYTEEGVQPHVYAALLNTIWIATGKTTEHPNILLDSTTYGECSLAPHLPDYELYSKTYVKQKQLFMDQNITCAWDDFTRRRVPLSNYFNDGNYDQVHTFITADYRPPGYNQDLVCQFYVVDGVTKSVSCDAVSFFKCDPAVRIIEVSDPLSVEEFAAQNLCVSDTPLSQFPKPPTPEQVIAFRNIKVVCEKHKAKDWVFWMADFVYENEFVQNEFVQKLRKQIVGVVRVGLAKGVEAVVLRGKF